MLGRRLSGPTILGSTSEAVERMGAASRSFQRRGFDGSHADFLSGPRCLLVYHKDPWAIVN